MSRTDFYGGVKIYSSVRDATKALGQGSGEAWMLVYGWTDVVSEPIELVPGAKEQDALCIAETFPVKQTGKETFRQVRVQGTLRVVAEYLKLLAENRFPAIWMPSQELLDLRALLLHRHHWVRLRTQIQNALQVIAPRRSARR
jgi:hypothetical protein